jgi:hypothetical protein
LQKGFSALVRRAQPEWFLPVGIAYDPLGRGRTRVLVSLGPRVEPPDGELEAATLALLRRATPLTCGQYVAHELVAGRNPVAARLGDAVEQALEAGRPVDPDLLDAPRRETRLAEAIASAETRPTALGFLAREYTSAGEAP